MHNHIYVWPPKGSTETLQYAGFRENLLTMSMSVFHEMLLSFSKPLSQHSIVSLHTQKREEVGERERERERERGVREEGRLTRGVSKCECSVLLTLAIWEQHFFIHRMGC